MEQLYVPTIDYTPPLMEDLERACEFMRRHAESGNGIYGASPVCRCAVCLS